MMDETSTPERISRVNGRNGVEDPAERVRRQNRLRQRALRNRRALAKQLARPAPGSVFVFERCEAEPCEETQCAAVAPGSRVSGALQQSRPSRQQHWTSFTKRVALVIGPAISHTGVVATPVRSSFTFPLSRDHHFITLIQYNVLRGTLTNMAILSLLGEIPATCLGALTMPRELLFEPPDSPPPCLEPTPLQRQTPHDAWMDLAPSPTLRDNLIRLRGSYDVDDLSRDLMGGLWEGLDDEEFRGIMVWRDPWCADGWEISEGFAKKWGFLLRGCHDIVKATNRWRRMRGEDDIVVFEQAQA